MAALLTASSCNPPTPPKPPIKTPSVIITDEGIQFYVYGFKLPGTSQELKLKQGGATTWVPISVIQVVTFSGTETDRYRPADIVLTSGEKLKGDLFVDLIIEGVFVDLIIEGATDLGYWNMPLAKVKQLGLGAE
ncbi:MAG: hypothetical protein NTW80_04350 [Deltaproteobacteria bacterium]|nr:hypothetical protein [Deltaproteobacteria bacterium]